MVVRISKTFPKTCRSILIKHKSAALWELGLVSPERRQLPLSFQAERSRVYRARSRRLTALVGHARPSSSTEAYLIAVFPLRVWAQRLVVLHELSKDMRSVKRFYGSAHTTQGPVTMSVNLRTLRMPLSKSVVFLTATWTGAAGLIFFAIFGNRIGL